MRTQIPHILPGCIYCDFDHDPAIECRFKSIPEPKGLDQMDQMEHKHHPIEARTVYQVGPGERRKTEFCVCGAIRKSTAAAGTWRCGEWIFPEDPPPAASTSSAEPFCNPLQKRSKAQYVAKHGNVLLGSANVATAKSHTFAKRIARALNFYQSEIDKGTIPE